MEEIVEVVPEQTTEIANSDNKSLDKKPMDKKLIIIIILAVAVLVLAGLLLSGSGTAGVALLDNGGDATLAENQGRPLPGGTYIVGEDIPAGKYMLLYTTTMTEEDYWSNDYLWITKAGSEGENETLGGMKFDDRFGSVEYEDAASGEAFYTTFSKGDTIKVDSEYGDWTY